MYPLSTTLYSMFLESYPLSRQRFCTPLPKPGFSITILSRVSVAAFMSCILAEVMTTDNGMPS